MCEKDNKEDKRICLNDHHFFRLENDNLICVECGLSIKLSDELREQILSNYTIKVEDISACKDMKQALNDFYKYVLELKHIQEYDMKREHDILELREQIEHVTRQRDELISELEEKRNVLSSLRSRSTSPGIIEEIIGSFIEYVSAVSNIIKDNEQELKREHQTIINHFDLRFKKLDDELKHKGVTMLYHSRGDSSACGWPVNLSTERTGNLSQNGTVKRVNKIGYSFNGKSIHEEYEIFVYDKSMDQTRSRCTIRFDLNGGSGNMKELSMYSGDELPDIDCELIPPDDCVFARWSLSPNGDEMGMPYLINESITLYPVWDKKKTEVLLRYINEYDEVIDEERKIVAHGENKFRSPRLDGYVPIQESYSVAINDDNKEVVIRYRRSRSKVTVDENLRMTKNGNLTNEDCVSDNETIGVKLPEDLFEKNIDNKELVRINGLKNEFNIHFSFKQDKVGESARLEIAFYADIASLDFRSNDKLDKGILKTNLFQVKFENLLKTKEHEFSLCQNIEHRSDNKSITVIANYSVSNRKYEVTWEYTCDGKTTSVKEEYGYGVVPSPPKKIKNKCKKQEQECSKTTSWSPEISEVVKDTKYTAVFR